MGVSATDIASLPHPSDWPHRPVLMVGCDQINKNNQQPESLPVGKPVPIDTDLFKGCFYIRIRKVDPHADDAEKHKAYFGDKKRMYQMVIQGQFKKEGLTFKDILIGNVYDRPLKGVPHGTIGKLIKKTVETMAPGMNFGVFDDERPAVLVPIGACQTFRADLPGKEPTDFNNIEEDATRLGKFDSISKRRKGLGKPSHAAKYKIDTNHVYTFEFFDNIMDFGTFHKHIALFGGINVDLVPFLDSQSVSLCLFPECVLCTLTKPSFSFRVLK
ncbi:hypothetical protein ACHAWF_006589 [Thalassiosira exigua]